MRKGHISQCISTESLTRSTQRGSFSSFRKMSRALQLYLHLFRKTFYK